MLKLHLRSSDTNMLPKKTNIKKYIDSEITPFIVNMKDIIDSAMEKLSNSIVNDLSILSNRITTLENDLNSHISNKNNPHSTTMDMLVLDTQFRAPLSSEGKNGDYFIELIK